VREGSRECVRVAKSSRLEYCRETARKLIVVARILTVHHEV